MRGAGAHPCVWRSGSRWGTPGGACCRWSWSTNPCRQARRKKVVQRQVRRREWWVGGGCQGINCASCLPMQPPRTRCQPTLRQTPGRHLPLCELGVVVALAVGGACLHSHEDGGGLAIGTRAGVGDLELGGAAVGGGAHGAYVCRVRWGGWVRQAGGWIERHRFKDAAGFAIRAQEV